MKIDNRIWILITVVVSGAILAGAWFLGASPFLQAAATSAASLVTVESQNAATSSDVATLKASQSKLPALKSELTELRKAVPNGVEGTSFIAEINEIASGTGVSVDNISLESPKAYAPPAAPAAAGTPGTAATPAPSASPSASATATPAPTATGPAAPPPTTDGLITGSNFIVVPVTVSVKGTTDQVSAFLKGLQHGSRLILVTDITTQSNEDGQSMTIGGSIYVLRATTAAAAGASANG